MRKVSKLNINPTRTRTQSLFCSFLGLASVLPSRPSAACFNNSLRNSRMNQFTATNRNNERPPMMFKCTVGNTPSAMYSKRPRRETKHTFTAGSSFIDDPGVIR